MNDTFVEFARGLRTEVEAELGRLLPPDSEPPSVLHRAMRYSVFAGGKRVRPALVVLGGEAFGAPREDLLAPAAALEMVHTFSLVHDDLPALDNDDLRRGRPTVHREFDEATAVLVGDALLNLGLSVLMQLPATASASRLLRAASLVAEAVGTSGMIGGQMADLEAENDWAGRSGRGSRGDPPPQDRSLAHRRPPSGRRPCRGRRSKRRDSDRPGAVPRLDVPDRRRRARHRRRFRDAGQDGRQGREREQADLPVALWPPGEPPAARGGT